MATRTWDGDTNTDWATAANWSGDTLPVDADTVIFDGRYVTGPTTGMTDGTAVNSGVDGSNAFALMHIKNTFTGNIGTAALPCCCMPTTLIIEGSGTYHINCAETNQSTNATIARVIINNLNATVYLYSNANDGANTCEFTRVDLIAGTLYAAFYSADTDDQGVYIANLYVAPQNNSASAATVIIEKDAYKVNGTVATNIEMSNGTLRSDSMIGTLVLNDGTVNYGSENITTTVVSEADMNIAAIRQYGGTFNWYPDDTAGDPTITTIDVFGGLFDASQNGATYSPDIAKTLADVRLYRGATMKLNNNRANITVTSYRDFGGTLTTDTGAKIAVTYDTA